MTINLTQYQISALFNGEMAFVAILEAETEEEAKAEFLKKFKHNFVQESKWCFEIYVYVAYMPKKVGEFKIGKAAK